jgi:hypothetical protein
MMIFLGLAAGLLAASCGYDSPRPQARAAEGEGRAAAVSLDKPAWKVGDRWVIETLTERIQGRETGSAAPAARVRWEFEVSKIESIAGHECYRIDIQCRAAGRLQPKSSVWCDKSTLFLRQFQTQLAVDGQYRTIQESYDCGPGQVSPVLASINALPLAMPAFLPKGSKSLGSFSYKSQPLPGGAKDPSIIRFVHTVSQEVLPPGAKSLERVPSGYAKELPQKPVTEVRLGDYRQKVLQLWQKDAPWPVYTDNGRTKAWLVSSKHS